MNQIIKYSGKNYQIQALRAIFCFLIVFFHYSYRYCELYNISSVFHNSFVYHFSSFGIISFFFLSGFYLTNRKDDYSLKCKVFFWLKRFLNLYLVYLVAIIVIFIVSYTGLYGIERTVSFYEFAQNVLFLNVFLNTKYVDGAHWYVFSVICLYFFAFLFDLFSRNNKKLFFIFWTIVLIVSLICLLILKYNLSSSKIIRMINILLCYGYFPYVYIGIVAFYIDYDRLICKKNILMLLPVIISFVYIAIESMILFFITLLSICIIMLALIKKLGFIEYAKPLIIVGNCSYSIYLVHQNIGYMFLNIISNKIGYYYSLLIVILGLLIGLIFSILFEHNIKKVIFKIFTCDNFSKKIVA